jgi:hypothetical protein
MAVPRARTTRGNLMATGSIPHVGTRVSVQMFAGDVLAHAGLVEVEHYQGADGVGALFSDGAGVRVVFSGDRSSVRMVLSAALAQLGPEVELNPDPPEAE